MSLIGSTEVRIERQKRRTLQLSLHKNWILIKVPLRTTDEEIQSFVKQHLQWIEKQLNKQNDNQRTEHNLIFLGELWHLCEPEDPTQTQIMLDIDLKTITVKEPVTESDWSRIDRHLAQTLLPGLFKSVTEKLGIKLPPMSLKTLRRAWGVCHSKGHIELHWKLVRLSQELAVYVMCHELAHLVHMDHSQAFWALCDQYIPGARAHDRALKAVNLPS